MTGGALLEHPTNSVMKKLLFFAFSLILYSNFAFTQSAKLHTQELKVMKVIWKKLGLVRKKEWDFDKDPCSGQGNWGLSVLCDCSFESNTTCHVNAISLRSYNVSTSLPSEFVKLRHLHILDFGHNYLSGTIPSEWAAMRLSNLHIQGCSFEGPIPSSISVLTKLFDLRISDLKGVASTFPLLEKMTRLTILVLRNCLIHGTIPEYVGKFRSLISLYLTKNNLTGLMPGWVLSSTKNVDVSYNHFTWDDASGPKRCEQETINVVESYSSSSNKQNNIHPCLRKDFPCTKSNAHKILSLHINCGGEEVNINNIKYEADTNRRGASSYYNGGNWAFSSTGSFLYDAQNVYILSNTSKLHNISTSDAELYTKARTAAISLTYYGLCLINGNYTVRLHFAEIVFTQDRSLKSPGKRVFDVYVQGELKLKDFDIVKEAGGTGRAVVKSYRVDVKNNTLKIQLYWAGKGTADIPVRGSYGPIISAISVDPLHMRQTYSTNK